MVVRFVQFRYLIVGIHSPLRRVCAGLRCERAHIPGLYLTGGYVVWASPSRFISGTSISLAVEALLWSPQKESDHCPRRLPSEFSVGESTTLCKDILEKLALTFGADTASRVKQSENPSDRHTS